MKKYTKAVTFSFDDGNESDIQLIQLLNKYNLKCSFNISSGKIESPDTWIYRDKFTVRKLNPFKEKYFDGHEICAHGLLHRRAPDLDDAELLREFKEDIENLEKRFGVKIVGAAYAFGLYDTRVIKQLEELGLKFARSVKSDSSFSTDKNMMAFNPTCHYRDENTDELIDKFLSINDDTPSVFYIWGHSYEIEGNNEWDRFEDICKRLAGRDDILYGTNAEVFEYFNMI